jgi:non-heme chloroperoxidase
MGAGLKILALAGTATAVVALGSRRRWANGADPTGGRPLEMPEHGTTTVTTRDGAELAVWTMGDPSRPPIVLVHGWTGAQDAWATIARQLLANGRRVVSFDQRGHGASTLGEEGTTLDALAGDLVEVLEAIDARHAVVVGHSMGGMSVQTMAVTRPDVVKARVAGLVLASTEAADSVPTGLVLRLGEWLVSSQLSTWALSDRFVGPVFTRSSFGKSASLVTLDATRKSWATTPPAVRSGFLEAMSHLDLLDQLASIDVPTVVISGTKDRLVVPAHTHEIARRIPGARLEILSGVGHQVIFEVPQRVAQIIDDLATAVAPSADAPSADAPSGESP